MDRKIGLLAALAVIMTVGLAFAATATETNDGENSGCPKFFGMRGGFGGRGFFPGMKENLGLPEGATREQARESMQEKMEERMNALKEELGLPEDATQEQAREAMQEKRASEIMEEQEERMAEIREKLGLPEEATEEEVLDALEEWREENSVLIRGMHRGGFRNGDLEWGMHQGGFRHKGFGGSMRGFGRFWG